MDRVSSLIGKVLRKRGLHEHAVSAHVVHAATTWLEARSPTLATSTLVKNLKNGVLTLECSHAIALQEAQAGSRELLFHLQETFGPTLVVQIRVERA